MSITVYKATKHRVLSGKKIYYNDSWITIPDNAKMYLHGSWHIIGYPPGHVDVPDPVIPSVPSIQSITHSNGNEPSSGTTWYITPNGNGLMDGTSWENAAPNKDILVVLTQCSPGDNVYFSEGAYTSNAVIALPPGVNLYGGFDSISPSWGTRDGFSKPTVFSGDGTFNWLTGDRTSLNQVIDGISVTNYLAGIVNGNNLVVRNAVFTASSVTTTGNVDHCVFSESTLIAADIYYVNVINSACRGTGSADHINVYTKEGPYRNAYFENGNVANSVFAYAGCTAQTMSYCDIYYGQLTITGSTADHINVYDSGILARGVSCSSGTLSNSTLMGSALTALKATDCTIYNGSHCFITSSANNVSVYGTPSNLVPISLNGATNCYVCYGVAWKWPNKDHSIFSGVSVNCVAFNCSSDVCIYSGTSTNSKAINCTIIATAGSCSIFWGKDLINCVAVNCTLDIHYNYDSLIFNSDVYPYGLCTVGCIAINCTADILFKSKSRNVADAHGSNLNCIAINCNSDTCFVGYTEFCTVVNCSTAVLIEGYADNSVFWNNASQYYGPISSCAGPVYGTGISVVLGYDNSIAKFINTGYYPACGVQDVSDCPSPIDDPTSYSNYIASFGDWRPQATSFLIGQGIYNSSVTTDINGVTRPDPPTMGAYEPVPTTE